jgi:hypothetical protein
MLVGKRCPQHTRLPTNIRYFVKFRISKIHNILDIKLIFLKLWIFTNFNTVFPVVVLVFDFEEFSEEVLHGHWDIPFSSTLAYGAYRLATPVELTELLGKQT